MAKFSKGLQTFNRLFKDVNTLTGWGLKGTIAVPLVDLIFRMGPPWPSQLPILTSVAQLVVLIVLTTFLTAKSIKMVMITAALACCFSLLGYLMCSGQWVHEAPDGTRLVAGFNLRADTAALIGPTYLPHEALRDGGWNPLEVWTRGSVLAAQLLLVAMWFSTFASFVVLVGAFAVKQTSRGGGRHGR
jgi:hypothetical protein